MWLLIPLLPPSFGRRWRVAPEVGFALFRLRPTPALRASPFHGKGVDGLLILLLPPSARRRWRVAPEVGFALFRFQPTPCHGKGVDGLLILLLPPSFGRRWRAAPEVGFALFRLRPTPALRASLFHRKGGIWATHPASPSSGRRWRIAPEVGFALFRLRPTPALRASPFHGKGVEGLLAHSSTLHYPFTENGFQILATFIELKMNLKIGQSHYF